MEWGQKWVEAGEIGRGSDGVWGAVKNLAHYEWTREPLDLHGRMAHADRMFLKDHFGCVDENFISRWSFIFVYRLPQNLFFNYFLFGALSLSFSSATHTFPWGEKLGSICWPFPIQGCACSQACKALGGVLGHVHCAWLPPRFAHDGWPLRVLFPGGTLLWATCSITSSENSHRTSESPTSVHMALRKSKTKSSAIIFFPTFFFCSQAHHYKT